MDATAGNVAPTRSAAMLGGHSRHGYPRPPLEYHTGRGGQPTSNTRGILRFLAACLDPAAGPPVAALALLNALTPVPASGSRLAC
jgi:hypothetical protein